MKWFRKEIVRDPQIEAKAALHQSSDMTMPIEEEEDRLPNSKYTKSARTRIARWIKSKSFDASDDHMDTDSLFVDLPRDKHLSKVDRDFLKQAQQEYASDVDMDDIQGRFEKEGWRGGKGDASKEGYRNPSFESQSVRRSGIYIPSALSPKTNDATYASMVSHLVILHI